MRKILCTVMFLILSAGESLCVSNSSELLTAKIKRHSSRKYHGFFSYGTGEEAKRARYLEWEF